MIEASAEALEARCFEGVAFQAGRGHRRGRALRSAHRNRAAGSVGPRRSSSASWLPGGAAVVNADDPHAEILGGVNLTPAA